MNSGDLVPNDGDKSEPASSEVQFALVIARMIETVKNNPEHMRQTVYDLARYKLQEQFTYADAKDIKRTQQALETAIRGLEDFLKREVDVPIPTPIQQVHESPAASRELTPPPRELTFPNSIPPIPVWLTQEPIDVINPVYSQPVRDIWPPIKRTLVMLSVVGMALLALLQRDKLMSLVHPPQANYERQAAVPDRPAAASLAQPATPPVKSNAVRPTDFGIYAVANNSLFELQPLPGRPPDIRIAVSAALRVPRRTVLPNGHPKFIVFRREAATNAAERAEVRVVAKIAREFSSEAAGRKLDDEEWVIRNVSFPFRASPLDSPEMYELHSEDPTLELTPGRYALILKNQAYDFVVEGETVDPKQCIERIIASNGTFYSDCKKPYRSSGG